MRKVYLLFVMLLMSLTATVSAQEGESTVTNWDGSAKSITLKSGEAQTFSYQADAKGTFYVFCKDQSINSSLKVSLSGGWWADGDYVADSPLQNVSSYENGLGFYGTISVWDGDLIRFTLQASENSENPEATVSFTLESLFFDSSVKGSSWESPIDLTVGGGMTIPVYTNHETDFFNGFSNLTFCRFTAPSDGVVNVRSAQYEILYMQEDLFDGSTRFSSAIESNTTQYAHEFAVTKDKAYLVAIPNARPDYIGLNMVADRIGESCSFPIEVGTLPTSLNLVKGHNWVKMDVSDLGEQTMLELAISAGWNGTITYWQSCLVQQEETLGSDSATCEAKTFYKNLDPNFTLNNDYQYIDIYVKDVESIENGVSLSLRAPQAGETCAMAIPVTSGETTISGPARDYWYVYTPTKDGEITLSCTALLSRIQTSCEGSNQLDLKGEHTYRVYAEQPVLINVRKSSTDDKSLTITEQAAIPGVYCDYPIDAVIGTDFVVADRLTNSGKEFQTTYIRFTAEQSGYAVFETSNDAWTTQYWTLNFRNECNGRTLPITCTEFEDPNSGALSFRYKLAVSEGLTYIFELTSSSNGGKNIIATSRYEAAQPGETCEDPIIITELGQNIALTGAADITTWLTYTADKSGFYTIACCARGTRQVLVGDCNASKKTISGDTSYDNYYMRGYGKLKVYVEEGTPFFIYIKTNNTPYVDEATAQEDPFFVNVTFSEPRPGETFAGAIAAEAGVTYDMPTGNDAFDTWYTYTIPAQMEQLIEIGSEVMNYANLTFYNADNTTMSSYKGDFTQESVFNDDNKICGKKYNFVTGNEPRVVYIYAAVQKSPITWKISQPLPVGIQNAQATTLTIAPNPNNGVFTVTVPAVENGATVVVRTLAGAEVYNAPLTATRTTVNLSGKLGAGIYLVTVNNGNTTTGKMIIK